MNQKHITDGEWEKVSAPAKKLKVTNAAILNWAERYPDRIHLIRLPGSYRVRKGDVESFLEALNNGEVE